MTTVLREPEQERLYTFKLFIYGQSARQISWSRSSTVLGHSEKKPNPRWGTAISRREEYFVTLLNVE
jgi:hypothetical protein